MVLKQMVEFYFIYLFSGLVLLVGKYLIKLYMMKATENVFVYSCCSTDKQQNVWFF